MLVDCNGMPTPAIQCQQCSLIFVLSACSFFPTFGFQGGPRKQNGPNVYKCRLAICPSVQKGGDMCIYVYIFSAWLLHGENSPKKVSQTENTISLGSQQTPQNFEFRKWHYSNISSFPDFCSSTFHLGTGNHRILKMKCRAHWQRYIQAIAHASNEDIFEFHGCQARGAADAGMWGMGKVFKVCQSGIYDMFMMIHGIGIGFLE